jgi:hypothetical protein
MSVVSGDKRMNKARGPGWPTTQTAQGILPEGLRGLDQEATWSKRHSDGWVDGHSPFCLVVHSPCLRGAFKYMRNSAHEAKRLWLETGHLRGIVDTVMMDRKADDKDLFFEFQRQRQMTLVTTPRRNSDHTEARRQMTKVQNLPKNQRLRTERGQTVEPMQGLVQLVMKNYPNWLDFEDACRYLWPRQHCTAGRRSRWHAAANHPCTLSYPSKSARPWNGGNGRPPSRQGWHVVGRSFSSWLRGTRKPRWPRPWVSNGPWCANGPGGFALNAWMAWLTPPAAVPRALFPPEVAIHVVRLACERPDILGRSLSQWDCAELAHQLIAEAIVEDISASTVRRLLAAHQLKPWRHHLWLHPNQPRDAAF